MTTICLENKVVIVTGSARGIGLAHAKLLAKRGASVVVNDVGVDRDGLHGDRSLAIAVATEICEAGGTAIADSSDVSSPDGGEALVETALRAFGRLDAVVNNAGIYYAAPLCDTSFDDFERVWRVNVGGHINVIKAAWPVMTKSGGGRIVTTGSGSGLFGIEEQSAYGSSKAAVYGLTRALALEGRGCGIAVNMIAPGGATRMMDTTTSEPEYQEMINWTKRAMPPELVAPAVAWLVSDACDCTGQVFSVWAGRVARVATAIGPGFVDRNLTPEAISENFEAVASIVDFTEPSSFVEDIIAWRAKDPAF
jgi:NAD(P)-dependent dehydrogenase (short-subunit alcohol dehydrogenase family)